MEYKIQKQGQVFSVILPFFIETEKTSELLAELSKTEFIMQYFSFGLKLSGQEVELIFIVEQPGNPFNESEGVLELDRWLRENLPWIKEKFGKQNHARKKLDTEKIFCN